MILLSDYKILQWSSVWQLKALAFLLHNRIEEKNKKSCFYEKKAADKGQVDLAEK